MVLEPLSWGYVGVCYQYYSEIATELILLAPSRTYIDTLGITKIF